MSERKFRRVINILKSVEMSTDKEIYFKNEGYQIARQNSPYIAHRKFRVTYGHHIPKSIFIPSHGILIVSEDTKILDTSINIEVYRNFPSFIVRKALDKALAGLIPLPKWMFHDFVHIILDNFFVGFDEEGKPKYDYTLKSVVNLADYYGEYLGKFDLSLDASPDDKIEAEDEEE